MEVDKQLVLPLGKQLVHEFEERGTRVAVRLHVLVIVDPLVDDPDERRLLVADAPASTAHRSPVGVRPKANLRNSSLVYAVPSQQATGRPAVRIAQRNETEHVAVEDPPPVEIRRRPST